MRRACDKTLCSFTGWIPLFIYTFPVTALAAIFLSMAGVGFEGWSHTKSGLASGPFNWVQRGLPCAQIFTANRCGHGADVFNVVFQSSCYQQYTWV